MDFIIIINTVIINIIIKNIKRASQHKKLARHSNIRDKGSVKVRLIIINNIAINITKVIWAIISFIILD